MRPQRETARIHYHIPPPVVGKFTLGDRAVELSGHLLDVSANGIGVTVDQDNPFLQMSAEAIFRPFRIHGTRLPLVWTRLVYAKREPARDGFARLGFRFIHPPPQSITEATRKPDDSCAPRTARRRMRVLLNAEKPIIGLVTRRFLKTSPARVPLPFVLIDVTSMQTEEGAFDRRVRLPPSAHTSGFGILLTTEAVRSLLVGDLLAALVEIPLLHKNVIVAFRSVRVVLNDGYYEARVFGEYKAAADRKHRFTGGWGA
ncbi:MAG: hypothetical protein KatS3mg082_1437 [Nitrospiraceae bacterium]|nr:MAG: hypothetical protein KatS3mg082_1437 [Nitrospiraceae bacterium]